MTDRSFIQSTSHHFSMLLAPAKAAAFALTLVAPSGAFSAEELTSTEPLRVTPGPRWNLVWKDSQECHVVDIDTGQTTLGSLDVIKDQLASEDARQMVRLVGPWPEEMRAMIAGEAPPVRPEVQDERTELRAPTQQDAREHAQALVTSARSRQLQVIEATPTKCTVMSNGVQFTFDVTAERGCVVSAPGMGPYQLNDISYRDIYSLMTGPSGAAPEGDQKARPKNQERVVSDVEHIPDAREVDHASPEVVQTLRATLSEYCRDHALTDENLSGGVLSFLIETPLGEACYTLVNREEKKWSVAVEGHGETTMSGIPYSVAARLFEREGKHELAATMAHRGGMKLESSQKGYKAAEEPSLVEEQSRVTRDVVVLDEHYNIRKNCAHITAADIESTLRGVLQGKGQLFVEEARKYNLCPLALAAISAHESDNGRSDLARNKNNVFGIYSEKDKEYRSYDSVEACIRFTAKLLGSYCDEKEPKQTIAEIQGKYAPLNVENDPKKLNRHWRSGVVRWMRTIGGSDHLPPAAQLAVN